MSDNSQWTIVRLARALLQCTSESFPLCSFEKLKVCAGELLGSNHHPPMLVTGSARKLILLRMHFNICVSIEQVER